MVELKWDEQGKRQYETGVDKGVLYLLENGAYKNGEAWNGLTAVKETPSGGEPTTLWANNNKYAVLTSAEELGLTIEAYTYPDSFEACDGTVEVSDGVTINQQDRVHFGLAYRTLLGNDEKGTAYGYKLHLVYDCLASPSEKERSSVNDSPNVNPFSWSVTTTPVPVENHKPTAMVTIDSTKVDVGKLKKIEEKLYGTSSQEPTLPSVADILQILSGE